MHLVQWCINEKLKWNLGGESHLSLFRCLLLFLLMFFSMSSYCSSSVKILSDTRSYELGLHMDILEDLNGEISIEEIMTTQWQSRFTHSQESIPYYGFSDSIFWFRIKLENQTATQQSLVLEVANPLLDYVTLYIPYENGIFNTTQGDHLPLENRKVKYKNYVYLIELQAKEIQTLYFRIQTTSSAKFPLFLWKHEAFMKKSLYESQMDGIVLGIIFIMSLYNLIVYIMIRDLIYLYLSLFIAGIGLSSLALNGIGQLYFWPSNLLILNNAPALFPFITIIPFLLFIRHFNKINILSHSLDKLLKGLLIAAIVFIPIAILGDYQVVAMVTIATTIIISVLSMVVAVFVLLSGQRCALYFIIAFVCFLLGAILKSLVIVGFIVPSYLTENGYLLGAVLAVFLLSLGVFEQLNVERRKGIQLLVRERDAIKALHETEKKSAQTKRLTFLGEMATRAAHELNQPLNVVSLAAGNLLNKIKKDGGIPKIDYMDKKLTRIIAEAKRASSIIQHMRIYANHDDKKASKIFLPDNVNSLLSRLDEQLSNEGIRVESKLPDICPLIFGYKDHVEEIIMELVTNARHALLSRPDDSEKYIKLTVDNSNKNKLAMIFEDSGGGIPDRDIERIFEPFFTTSDFFSVKQTSERVGLGLSIAYGLIKDMKGDINVTNTHQGVKFEITFPTIMNG